MPELPEVETIKNELTPLVVGRRIKGVDFLWHGTLSSPSPDEFSAAVKGRRVTGLGRRGKYLIFELDSDKWLLVHLKMTGSFLVGRDSATPPEYTRAVMHLGDGSQLFFIDPRKFGKFRLLRDKDSFLNKLGPEPLESGFSSQVLVKRLAGRKAPIKAVLVDQEVIAGIGNMYADEALFLARIHPLRPANSLSSEEMKRLHRAIRRVLRLAIESKGASIANYFRPGGEVGSAHSNFRVAHRKDEVCPGCGGPIKRIVVRQRGTYFCPRCQA